METETMAKKQGDEVRAANEDAPASGQDDLTLEALAQGVLAREVPLRVTSMRRLAEGVLALQADLKAAEKKLKKTAKDAATSPAKSGRKKKKKLAKIPGQKKDK